VHAQAEVVGRRRRRVSAVLALAAFIALGGPALACARPDELRSFDAARSGDDSSGLAYRKGRFAADGIVAIPLLVDRTVSRLVVAVSADDFGEAVLQLPGGQTAEDGKDGARIATAPWGQTIAVDQPEAGRWSLDLSGSGAFTLDAQVHSPIRLADLRFVRPDLDVPGEYLPISGAPVADDGETPVLVEATLRGRASSSAFTLESESGEHLDELPLNLVSLNRAGTKFRGVIRLPSAAFRVVVSGNVPAREILPAENVVHTPGLAFRRVFPTAFRARSAANPAARTIEVVGPEADGRAGS